jgi:two-component system, LytTR family, response regulator
VTPIRVLIVDDEPPARRRIRALLADEPGVEVVAEAGSGAAAVAAIREHAPDLVFLDIQMPEGDGFDVVGEIGAERMPLTVFATAHDEHAVRAFEAHALDYLLKPYDRDRFAVTMRRARARLAAAAGTADPRLDALLGSLRREERYASRITLRSGPRIRVVPVAEIDYVRAEDNYVRLHVGERSYLHRETLASLEARLDPRAFLRIHRSALVNLDRVAELEVLFAGDYTVFLRDGTRLPAGRTYRTALQEALGLRP